MTSRKAPVTEITVLYGSSSARGTGKREVHIIKKHMDVFVDDIGIGKVVDIKIDNGCIAVLPEPTAHPPLLQGERLGKSIMVETYKIRPMSVMVPYEVKRLINTYENKRK